MDNFLKDNKWIVIVIIVSFIIGGFLYLINQRNATSFTAKQKHNISYQSGLENRNCIPYTQASDFIGEKKCIYGKVIRVYISKKGNAFLDFCQDYRNCPFSSVIFNSDVPKFLNLDKYEGKEIEITGLVNTYQGKPEIIINDPTQIKIK